MILDKAMEALCAADYFSAPGLSNSGMKDLAVSPLRYWFKNVNPNRTPEEPTAEMEFGTALHTAILEPGKFNECYACKLNRADFQGLLDTMDDLRGWLSERGISTSAKRKRELVERVTGADPSANILELLEEQHAIASVGKILFSVDDWARLQAAAEALRNEPALMRILSDGQPEVAMFATDRETGVRLKGRLDWVTPQLTLDLKTFSQRKGKTIDRSIADAILYERYYVQAFFYSLLRGWPKDFSGEHVIAFVESEAPHETRLRVLRPKTLGNVNLYFETARIEVRRLIRLYAACWEEFGEKPWRVARSIDPLGDDELPGLAY